MLSTAISHLRSEAITLYSDNQSYSETARILCDRYEDLPSPDWVRHLIALEISDHLGDQDIIEENVRLRKQKVRASDKLRKERRSQLEIDRKENAIEELLSAIQENLKNVGKSLEKTQRYSGNFKSDGTVLVVHLSDLHLQELIDLPSNKFDFIVASKRLQLMAQKIKSLGTCFECNRIVLAITGDIINSDRRHDEVLNNATNRSKAVVLATHLLRQFILDLRQNFFIDVIGVCGNEGRAKMELAWSDIGATDSYDALVYWSLQQVLEGDKGLRFNELQSNECVFSVHKETFLAVHGHQIKMHDQKAIQALMAKYIHRGIEVTHVIAGHIHSAMVSDFASRNSSLCGSNSYSDSALSFISKASQNVHIVSENHLDGVKLDLQNTDGVIGYDTISELQRMGARTVNSQYTPDTQSHPIKIV